VKSRGNLRFEPDDSRVVEALSSGCRETDALRLLRSHPVYQEVVIAGDFNGVGRVGLSTTAVARCLDSCHQH